MTRAALEAVDQGATVGRYLVLSPIGTDLYAAYDPELDRKVALKLVRHSEGQERLVAEGRAMARLAHPNVVPVLDLGWIGERVFVAMELVQGTPLPKWLGSPRPWREVVAVLLAAGRGLSAAHAAGLTHEDFRAQSVLVGSDGRARVTDFGLSRSASVRDNQLAFCQVLRDSVTGEPASLRRVLDRSYDSMAGLLRALESLTQRRRRLGVTAGVTVAALALAAAALSWQRPALCRDAGSGLAPVWNPARRTALAAAFAASGVSYAKAIWPRVEASLDEWANAFSAMGREACEATEVHHTQPRELLLLRNQCLDERQAELTALIEVLAKPTPAIVERAVQAAASLRRVSDCADRARLLGPVRPPLGVAVEAETQRRRLGALRGRVDAGVTTGARAELSEIAAEARKLGDRALLGEALLLRSSQEYNDGDMDKALESGLASITAAEEGRDDRTRALAWIWQIVIAQERGSMEEARAAAETARAILTRVAASDEVRSQYEIALGTIEQNAGSPEAARDHFGRALLLLEKQLGPEHPKLAIYLGHHANALMIVGEYDAAEAQLRRALANIEKNTGRDHPSFAQNESVQALLELIRGRAEQAATLATDALERLERSFGRNHPELFSPLDTLNSAFKALGRQREALAVAERMLALGELKGRDSADAVVGMIAIASTHLEARQLDEAERILARIVAVLEKSPADPNARKAQTHLAQLHLLRHHAAKARAACQAAVHELSEGDHWGWLDGERCFAGVEEAEGAFERALARLRPIVAAEEKRRVSDAPWGLGGERVAMGRLLMRMGKRDEAVPLFEKALAGEPSPPPGVVDAMVEARVELAAADPARADRLALEAQALAAKQEHPDPELVAKARRLGDR